MDEEVEVGEMRWRRPDLPSRLLFVETFVQLYERIERPSFPAWAWTEVETDMDIQHVDIEDAVGDPEAIGRSVGVRAHPGTGPRISTYVPGRRQDPRFL